MNGKVGGLTDLQEEAISVETQLKRNTRAGFKWGKNV